MAKTQLNPDAVRDNSVTKAKLAQDLQSLFDRGARNPIIFTSETTEIDEQTYQKLLSDNVDVVFKTDKGNICTLTYKILPDSSNNIPLTLYFTCFSFEDFVSGTYLCGYSVNITNNTPHKFTIGTPFEELFRSFLSQLGLTFRGEISPVLQQIDLTGTDADRKAKLDQFEKDWKALIGATTLEGARFVGMDGETGVLFSLNSANDEYQGLSVGSDGQSPMKYVLQRAGSLTKTPLFSHLEPITIYTDNTLEHEQANIANIAAYEANLEMLGVDIAKSPMIPIITEGGRTGFVQRFNNTAYFGLVCAGVAYFTECKFIRIINDPTSPDINGRVFISSNILQNEDQSGYLITGRSILDTLNELWTRSSNPAFENLTIRGGQTPITINSDDTSHKISFNAEVAGPEDHSFGRTILSNLQQPVDASDAATKAYVDDKFTDNSLTTTSKKIVGAINEVNTLANAVKAFGAIELKANDDASNKTAITAYQKRLTDAQVNIANGYSVPVRITGNSQEYHGMLNIGTGTLLSGVVTDVNENHHYPFNVNTSDGAITFDENNYFLEKTSNEVTEMLDAIKYSYTPVPFTDTTLSNKAQLEVFLSKVPSAAVMHCTYMEVYAGTLHKINGDWYGLLVKNTNNYEDTLQVKLQADGTLIKGTTSLEQVNAKLNEIIG